MKLIIHIGAQKTGTTTIQSFLKLNNKNLIKQGILIPQSIAYKNSFNHRWLCSFAYEDNNFNKIRSLKEIDNLGNLLISEKILEFKEEIKKNHSDLCIISSEHLSLELQNIDKINKLKNVLEDIFDDIKIVIYIRKPLKQAISLLSTCIRNGQYINNWYRNYPLKPKRFRRRNNIKKILKLWESNFPKNLVVRIFESEQLYENDLLKDFCKICKIDYKDNFLKPNKENSSLDLKQMQYINYLNKLIKSKSIDISSLKYKKITNYIRKNIRSKKFFKPSKVEYVKFEDCFKKDEAWIRKKYFPNRELVWLNDISDFRETKDMLNNLDQLEMHNLISFIDSTLNKIN